jgi:hypothetical protein
MTMTMTTMTRQVSIADITIDNVEKNINMSNNKPKRSKKRPPVFPARLYDLLENAEKEGYDHLIRWTQDGQSFKIQDNGKDKAIVVILKRHFNQTRFKSFLRQLQLYGFERRFKGQSRGECSHPMFVRGRKDLLYKKSIEEFQDAANDTVASTSTSKSTSCPSSCPSVPAPDELSSKSLSSVHVHVPVATTAAATTTTNQVTSSSSFHCHTVSRDTSFFQQACSSSRPALSRVVTTDQQQQQQQQVQPSFSSSFDGTKCEYFRNSSIPTRLVNLVLREEDYIMDDGDAADDASDSINVFNRNLFDTDNEDDGVEEENEVDAACRAIPATTTIQAIDYPEWTGSSIELKILQKL